MKARELIEQLLDYISDVRASNDSVLIRCDGALRTIESVETRLTRNGNRRPRKTFLLIIADGPADEEEIPATTLRTPRG